MGAHRTVSATINCSTTLRIPSSSRSSRWTRPHQQICSPCLKPPICAISSLMTRLSLSYWALKYLFFHHPSYLSFACLLNARLPLSWTSWPPFLTDRSHLFAAITFKVCPISTQSYPNLNASSLGLFQRRSTRRSKTLKGSLNLSGLLQWESIASFWSSSQFSIYSNDI